MSKIKRPRGQEPIKLSQIRPSSKAGQFLKQAAQDFVATLDEIADGFLDPKFSTIHGIRSWTKLDEEIYQKQEQKRMLKQMREKEMIRNQKKGDEFTIKLSDEGFLTGLKLSIIDSADMLPDGWFCLVVFDFPESTRDARQFWRRFIKQAGFKQFQLSVWYSPKNVVAALDLMIRLMDIGDWICAGKVTFSPKINKLLLSRSTQNKL